MHTHIQHSHIHTYKKVVRERKGGGKEKLTETERYLVPCIRLLLEDLSILFIHDVNFASIFENQLFSKVVFSLGKWKTQRKG